MDGCMEEYQSKGIDAFVSAPSREWQLYNLRPISELTGHKWTCGQQKGNALRRDWLPGLGERTANCHSLSTAEMIYREPSCYRFVYHSQMSDFIIEFRYFIVKGLAHAQTYQLSGTVLDFGLFHSKPRARSISGVLLFGRMFVCELASNSDDKVPFYWLYRDPWPSMDFTLIDFAFFYHKLVVSRPLPTCLATDIINRSI